jgi:REP element-mobilizing transposase RayT
MARVARVKFSDQDAWYHLHNRIAGHQGEFPLSDPAPTRRLIETIRHFSRIYFCEVAGFTVMGNHYHLIVKFDGPREVDPEELRERARIMYPSRSARLLVEAWSEEQWEHYRKRLFDVSEYMRNIQAAYARWYNRSYQRRGRFWADRFKSVVLGDERAVLDCLLYIELNAVRAGLVERPEDWQGSSAYLREMVKDDWLTPLKKLLNIGNRKRALIEFRELLYYRGAVPTRGGQAVISQEVLDREIARGFESKGVYLKRLGYFVDGLAIGSEEFIRDRLAVMREEGRYLRRKNPIPQLGGIHLSLREQRSTSIVF